MCNSWNAEPGGLSTDDPAELDTQEASYDHLHHGQDVTTHAQQIAQRDAALDLLRATRPDLIQRAREIAYEIARFEGTVTSPQVLLKLKVERPEELEGKDPRFMGCVFNRNPKWQAVGWDTLGSHGRPVRVWKWIG